MAEQDENSKSAEKRVTNELANQASQEPGSADEEQAKEKRSQAEKEWRDTQ